MQVLRSHIRPGSSQFEANQQGMLALVEMLSGHLEKSRFQGKERSLARAKAKGKFLARERIDLLLDQDSPFLELLPLAGLGGKGFGPGGTTVGGIGVIEGRLCMVISNIGTHKGGAVDYATLHKSLRLSEIAARNHLPTVNLVESAGANLPEQSRIFNSGGNSFKEISRRSRRGIPTVSVVFGNATAGGAYVPGMSDYSVLVKDQAKVFLAGPPLVKMATNEVVDDESLGGAAMHSRISGVSDYLAEDELDAIRIAREIVGTLKPSQSMGHPTCAIEEPLFSPSELLGVASPDVKVPFDAREVINRITDGSRFAEFKPDYGTTLVTGVAHIHGYKVGILANNGVLYSESANKGAHFIQLCNKNDIPLLFLQNVTGFMVGKEYEQGGIIKHGAKLINAVSNSDVPSITLMIGASYGAGNYAMNGKAYDPDFIFSWPNSRIAVMGAEQLAGVMEIIQRQATAKSGMVYDEEQAAKLRTYLIAENEKQSNAWYATGQIWDDGVIDPRDTRTVLGICLATVYDRPFEGSDSYGVFRM